jgi:hypothetical protein
VKITQKETRVQFEICHRDVVVKAKGRRKKAERRKGEGTSGKQ